MDLQNLRMNHSPIQVQVKGVSWIAVVGIGMSTSTELPVNEKTEFIDRPTFHDSGRSLKSKQSTEE